jgi:hypothetical protein
MRSILTHSLKFINPNVPIRLIHTNMATIAKQTHQISQEVLNQDLPLAIQIDKIAEIRKWFRPRDDSIWYPQIQAYLNGKTDLDETLRKIKEPIDEAISSNKLNDDFPWSDLWYSIFHSAKRLSFRDEASFEKLTSLMKAFQNNGQRAYEGFPELGMSSREAFNDSPGAGAGYSAPERSAWTSYNYLLARLTQEELLDNSLFAVWALAQALEVNISDSKQGEPMPGTKAQKVDALVPAAAVWVIGAGKALYGKEEDKDPKHGKKECKVEDLKDGERLWPASARFSKERWAFWKSRFGEFSGVEEAEEETRKVAGEAVEAMKKAEGQ